MGPRPVIRKIVEMPRDNANVEAYSELGPMARCTAAPIAAIVLLIATSEHNPAMPGAQERQRPRVATGRRRRPPAEADCMDEVEPE